MKKIIFFLSLIFASVALISCSDDDDNKVSEWDPKYEAVFNAGEWTADGFKLDTNISPIDIDGVEGVVKEDSAATLNVMRYYVKIDKKRYFPNMKQRLPYMTDKDFRLYPLQYDLSSKLNQTITVNAYMKFYYFNGAKVPLTYFK